MITEADLTNLREQILDDLRDLLARRGEQLTTTACKIVVDRFEFLLLKQRLKSHDSVKCNSVTGKPTDFEHWQYEYMFYLNPTMDTSGANDAMHEKILKSLDFDSGQAKAFQAGWEQARTYLRQQITEHIPRIFEDD